MELVVPDNVDDSIEARPTVIAAPGVPPWRVCELHPGAGRVKCVQLWILATDTLALSVLSLSSLGPTLAAVSAWFSSSSTSFIGTARCIWLTSSAVSGGGQAPSS